jgi:hypothetical protein
LVFVVSDLLVVVLVEGLIGERTVFIAAEIGREVDGREHS